MRRVDRGVIYLLLIYAVFYHSIRIYLVDNEIVTGAFVIISITFVLVRLRSIPYKSDSLIRAYGLLFLVFLLSGLVSLANDGTVYSIVRGLTIFPVYCMFILIGIYVYQNQMVETVLTLLVVLSVLSALYGIYQHFGGYTREEFEYSMSGAATYDVVLGTMGLNRAYGFQGGPADYSSFLMIGIIVCFFSITNRTRKYLVLVVLFIGQAFSLTRGPIVAELIAIPFASLVFTFRRAWILFVLVVLATALYSIRQTDITDESTMMIARFEQMRDPLEVSSMKTRFDAWSEFKNSFDYADFLWGRGVGSAGLASLNNSSPLRLDNFYLVLMMEVGVPGLFIFLGANSVLVRRFLKVDRRNLSAEAIAFKGLLFAGLASVLIACLTSEYLEQFPVKVLYFLFVGMSVSYLYDERKVFEPGE